MSVISSLYGDLSGRRVLSATLASNAANLELSRRQMYFILQEYYYNNNLYNNLAKYLLLYDEKFAPVKGLMNPAYSAVEFYPLNVWPGMLENEGTLDIVTEPPDKTILIEQIQSLWQRSNWNEGKEVFVRFLALYGDSLIRVGHFSTERKESVLEVVDPVWIHAIETSRNDVMRLRLDIPIIDEFADRDLAISNLRQYTTEMWDVRKDKLEVWTHDRGRDAKLRDLGKPHVTYSITKDFKIPFLPFVHQKFMSVGDQYGMGSFTASIEKIDELNQMATRLHHMLYRYNKSFMAVSSNSVDKDGRPIPAPNIGYRNSRGEDVVNLEDENILRLPGNAKLESLVPSINWDAHIAAIKDQAEELQHEMPELNYYDLNDNSGANARAAFFRMSPAIQKLKHVRGVSEAALIRADKMAMYIDGQFGVGPVYEDMDDKAMGHKFKQRPYMQLSQIDQEEADLAHINVLNAKKELGADSRTLLLEAGYTEKEVDAMEKQKQKDLLMMQQTFASSNGQMPTTQQQNGQAPQFNQQGNDANNPDDNSAVKQNGKARTVRGIEG